MNIFGIIYKVVNIINGKCYVGQTVRKLSERKASHLSCCRRNNNLYFYNSIRKYGEENFKWEILCECNSREELDEKEQYYIKLCNTKKPNGYNLTDGGNGMSGFKQSDEQKENRSRWMKGSGNHRFGKCGYWYGKKRPDHSKKMSGESHPLYGKHHMDETKLKIGKKHNKSYEIIFPNGEIRIVNELKLWCKENNINYDSFCKYKNTNKSYKGYLINKLMEIG